jgi:hypothetical protein
MTDAPRHRYATPEEAALSGWSLAAQPQVVRVRRVAKDAVEVLVDTEPSHPMWVRCELGPEGWEWVSDATA